MVYNLKEKKLQIAFPIFKATQLLTQYKFSDANFHEGKHLFETVN